MKIYDYQTMYLSQLNSVLNKKHSLTFAYADARELLVCRKQWIKCLQIVKSSGGIV